MKALFCIILLLCIAMPVFADCYLFGAWIDTEEIVSNCITSMFPGSSFCCIMGCMIPILLTPAIPDYHLLVYPSGVFHGFGWKIPFGITLFSPDYEWYPGFYVLSPRTCLPDEYEGFEDFNALRLEFLPEIIFTNSVDDIMYGIAGRLYIPFTGFISLHAEGGFLMSDDVFIPHTGGGVTVYLDLDEVSEGFIVYVQAAPKIMFIPGDEIAADIQISVKFIFF